MLRLVNGSTATWSVKGTSNDLRVYVLLLQDTLENVVGVADLPESYQRHFGRME